MSLGHDCRKFSNRPIDFNSKSDSCNH